MTAFRSRLRVVAVAWLVCQVASLSAFVPEDCCVTHTAMAEAKKAASSACHETDKAPEPKPGDACPMHQEDGAACPMHRSQSADCCAMSNGCDGPNRPLASLFSFIGVLDAPSSSITPPASITASAEPPALLLCRLVRPDAPPPKA